jgi:hypothetical protein
MFEEGWKSALSQSSAKTPTEPVTPTAAAEPCGPSPSPPLSEDTSSWSRFLQLENGRNFYKAHYEYLYFLCENMALVFLSNILEVPTAFSERVNTLCSLQTVLCHENIRTSKSMYSKSEEFAATSASAGNKFGFLLFGNKSGDDDEDVDGSSSQAVSRGPASHGGEYAPADSFDASGSPELSPYISSDEDDADDVLDDDGDSKTKHTGAIRDLQAEFRASMTQRVTTSSSTAAAQYGQHVRGKTSAKKTSSAAPMVEPEKLMIEALYAALQKLCAGKRGSLPKRSAFDLERFREWRAALKGDLRPLAKDFEKYRAELLQSKQELHRRYSMLLLSSPGLRDFFANFFEKNFSINVLYQELREKCHESLDMMPFATTVAVEDLLTPSGKVEMCNHAQVMTQRHIQRLQGFNVRKIAENPTKPLLAKICPYIIMAFAL